MIDPRCDICGEELKEFGAILLSPPNDINVNKYHICIKCFDEKIEVLIDKDS